MLLGDFETAQQAQNAVMASYACGFTLAALRQPHPPQLAEHLARRTEHQPNPTHCFNRYSFAFSKITFNDS